jgi:hypothetical protein
MPSPQAKAPSLARDLGIVALAKVAACALVLAAGFRAVSDDDFSRVVIAQAWAHAPRLDPTGTSWLPLPFWITGSAMFLFGRSLDVARATACVLGIASAVLVALAARRIAADRRGALAGALLAAVFPWSARLGVATVPELPAAALVVFAMASAICSDGRIDTPVRLWGAVALLGATLSRYEAWPVALGFSALCVVDAMRARPGGGDSIRAGDRGRLLLAAAVALAGPACWIAWNRHAHGDALHFVDRVTAYRRALGESPEETLPARLLAYPIAMAKQEPELLGLLLASVLAAAFVRRFRPAVLPWASPYARPIALAIVQIALLSVAILRGSAPTHHPERALLVLLLLVAIAAGDLGMRLLSATDSFRIRAALAAAGLLVILGGPLLVRRLWMAEDFLHRKDEVAIGRAAARTAHPGERVLVEAVDYGHFAVTAGLGRPEDSVIDRDLDPRRGQTLSSFEDPARLARKLAETGARHVIGRVSPATAQLGPPVVAHGAWALWSPAEGALASPKSLP